MKKILVIVSSVMVALVIFGAGFFFANQTNLVSAAGLPAGFGPGNMAGGRGGMMGGGQMREYVEQALADKLGMTKAEVETALDGGKSMYQLVLDKGFKEADVTALLTDVHKTGLAKAVSAGVVTQAQADAMLKNMTANAFNAGNCQMQNGAGQGARGGRGMGRGMGGWNQQSTTTNQ